MNQQQTQNAPNDKIARRKKRSFKKMLLIVIFFFSILAMAIPNEKAYAQASNEYITMNTQGAGEDIRQVVKTIAKQAGVNILCDKSVSGKVVLSLKDVYYETALNLIAKTNNLAVRKEGNTFIVGQAKSLAEGFDKYTTRNFKLNFAKPADVQKTIGDVYKSTTGVPVKVTSDTRINAVIVQGTKEQLDQIAELIKQIDVKVHQVLIEAKIVEVTTSGLRDVGMQWGWGTGAYDAKSSSATGKIAAITEAQLKNASSSSYRPELNSLSVGGQGDIFKLGDFFRGPMFFDAALHALESTGHGKILSNPKIATLNGQPASIEVGQKISYSTGGDQGAAEKDVGIKLSITAQINDEGWITAEISPEVSYLEGYDTATGKLPLIGKRLAKTVVRVKDGEEILIGGLIKEQTTNTNIKFPILGNIPLLKTFFSSKKTQEDTQQLIILIKPSIIPEQES
ncbi:MAG: secretin N-terminal domain-containing protein [Candidatus Wallbacteria bacterium]